jgi:nucleoside-diphosphate kinase
VSTVGSLQRSCVLVKPDAVAKKAVGRILDFFESDGLDLIAMKLCVPGRERIEEFYSVHQDKPFYPPLIDFMASGPIVATVWEGENAIARCRALLGATNSPEAASGTIRKLYGTDNRQNAVHGSDSEESAQREIGLFFSTNEICTAFKPAGKI